MLTRRDALKAAAVVVTAGLRPPLAAAADAGFTLPKLPYATDALEPHIDAKTMEIHHGRHHKAYVDNLNAALKDHPDWLKKPIDEVMRTLKDVPEAVRQAVTNNGGGHYNHTLFWEIMGKGGGKPSDELLKAWGASLDDLKAAVKKTALGRFGSGWAWAVYDKSDGRLAVVDTANQDCPLTYGRYPVLGVDVWEHAYYLKYQNKRADYVDAWWNVVNWDAVNERFAAAKKG